MLTMMGVIFDAIYFPDVHVPVDGYDPKDLDKEIARLEALANPSADLIGILKFTRIVPKLRGLCVMTSTAEDPFGEKRPLPPDLAMDIYTGIHGPTREGFTPAPSNAVDHLTSTAGGQRSVRPLTPMTRGTPNGGCARVDGEGPGTVGAA